MGGREPAAVENPNDRAAHWTRPRSWRHAADRSRARSGAPRTTPGASFTSCVKGSPSTCSRSPATSSLRGRDRGSSSPRGGPAEPGARLRGVGWLIAAAPSFLGLLAGLPRVFVAAILCVEAPDEVVHVRRHGLIFA